MKQNIFKSNLIKVVSVILIFAYSSCAFVERKAIDIIAPALPDAIENIMAFESAKIATKGLPGLALLISALIGFSPENPTLLAVASEAYTAYGLLLEWDDPKLAIQAYKLGKDYGLRALKCNNSDIREGLEENKHMYDIANKIEKDDIPAAFWYALSYGLGIMLQMDDPEKLMGLADVTSIVDRIMELDHTYFYYTPHLFKGAYAVIAGPLMGGGVDKAIKEFEIAFKGTGNRMLLAHVFYARYFATGIVDEQLYDKTLNYILETPNDVLPEGRLINSIAKIKANWLLKNKGEFF